MPSTGAVLQPVINSTSDTVTISWLPPDQLNNALAVYEIHYSSITNSSHRDEREITLEVTQIMDMNSDIPLTPMETTLDFLQSDTLYFITLTTYNIRGRGPTVNVTVRTQPSDTGWIS